jgi:DNA topoisomerase-1
MTAKTVSARSSRGKSAGKPSGRSRRKAPAGGGEGKFHVNPASADGKHLVIVESPTKAKTINKYLGSDYTVMASVGHVRDLPPRNPKGVTNPVPGVDLDHDFAPTYEILDTKKKTVADLKRAARKAVDIWFATDLDREGEAIAWHLAQALDVPGASAKRVVFNAITKNEIQQAFSHPRPIDEAKVNAQQARRILDRIVGYQVSPLLWKKVAGGLSAGRVQSVAVRLVVEREREIEEFIPQEYWKITAIFAADANAAEALAKQYLAWLAAAPEGEERAQKDRLQWLNEHQCMRAELTEFNGAAFNADNREAAMAIAARLGFVIDDTREWQDPKAKGMARFLVEYRGHVNRDAAPSRIKSIQTRRTSSRPAPPFITSSLQQAAATRLGFSLQRTMRIAQQLYEGVDIKGKEGQTGLITYMRTDSTHLSGEALNMARDYIGREWGQKYLPEKPNFFASKANAQEAHEAIRPTDVSITPRRVRGSLTDEQFSLYQLIWERFLACQMVNAEWDSTTVLIESSTPGGPAIYKTSGRTLVFEGFYKATGMPRGEEAILPKLSEGQPVAPLQVQPSQHFTQPPARYNEASLQKKLEEEGIGRPSTYAAIIQTIQDRKYVQQIDPRRDRRLYATDLGKVVTDKLVEAFPKIMDVAYTRQMEAELDKVEEEHHDWVQMLRAFYGPFQENLSRAHEGMQHAKAEVTPAPHSCGKCGATTVYRFGKNGRFLSCSRYPDCDYAAPIDREGNPQAPEMSDVRCPLCASGMTRRVGRFGAFLGCVNYPQCKGIVKLDPKKGTVILPKVAPLTSDVPCPKCASPLYVRDSKRGLWLSCSSFPKCRGRVAFNSLDEAKQAELQSNWSKHIAANPVPQIRNAEGQVIEEGYQPRIEGNGGGEEKATDREEGDSTSDAA